MRPANKVLANTGISYIRSLITVGISLYTTRVVLQALGSQDFGIYQLLSGTIAMLAFLNNAMATSTQRFLSFYQGRKDLAMQKVIFGNSLLNHLGIGVVIVVLLQIVGGFIFNGALNIPAERIGTAWTIYQFMAASIFVTILSVPFTGSLVVHENMAWVAVVNVLEAVAKLVLALILARFDGDKLILFGLYSMLISVLNMMAQAIYCLKKYPECSLKSVKLFEWKQARELLSYAGWNLFGSLCGLLRSQGLAVLLNIFHGARINAAYGVANQVSGQVNFFSSTLLRAMNPQIMKSEGADDRQRMLRLSMMASKFCFFLLAILAIPAIFSMDRLLGFWLAEVPAYTVIFSRLILLSILINQVTIGLQSGIQATGRIKFYQIFVGSLILLNIPISYTLLKLEMPVYYTLIGFCVIESCACIARLFVAKRNAGMSIKAYLDRVIFKETIPVIVSVTTCFFLNDYADSPVGMVFLFGVSATAFMLSIYLTGLCKDERTMLNGLLVQVRNKVPLLQR